MIEKVEFFLFLFNLEKESISIDTHGNDIITIYYGDRIKDPHIIEPFYINIWKNFRVDIEKEYNGKIYYEEK